MKYVADYAVAGQCAETLIVLLPGAQHGPADFIQAGFVSAVRERGLGLDLIMAELEFEQVVDLSALADLHISIMQPAQAAGYSQTWLAGISIGGYIAMAYAQRYPQLLHGMLLMAPYPGNRMTTNEIRDAGGIASWAPAAIAADDTERHNWRWLKTQQTSSHHHAPLEVHLAYGEDDRFAASHAMMAEALTPEHVSHIAGGHVWPVWQQLWRDFLSRRFTANSHA
jgi:pimeloyl-ACP methyl ester carboxylesterase